MKSGAHNKPCSLDYSDEITAGVLINLRNCLPISVVLDEYVPCSVIIVCKEFIPNYVLLRL